MMPTNSLNTLAVQARRGDPAARQQFCDELEAGLVPLVRCALRRGTGLPALVRWVQGNFAALADGPAPPDLAQVAPRIAHLLSARLVGEFRSAREPETVTELC
jgi:hypothetical protein